MKKILSIIMIIFPLFILNKSYCATGSSYCVLEESTLRVLEGKNEHNISLIASTTKILTALVAIESNNIYKEIKVTKEDTLMDGSKLYFDVDEEIYLVDVLYCLMLRSGNDCANIIAREVYNDYDFFIKKMNDKCKEIGMSNSTFSNPSGLDNDTVNYSTAYDMSLLMIHAMKNDIFREIASTISYDFKTSVRSYSIINKHKLVCNDERFIAGKTGYTKKSGRILVSYASINNMNVVITTINDSNDWNSHKRYLENTIKYNDIYIIEKGYFYYENYIIYLSEDIRVFTYNNEIEEMNIVIEIDVNGAFLIIYKGGKTILTRRLEISSGFS